MKNVLSVLQDEINCCRKRRDANIEKINEIETELTNLRYENTLINERIERIEQGLNLLEKVDAE